MFASWCVPVDQNTMKSALTTSMIGMLLTKKKKKAKYWMLYGDNIQFIDSMVSDYSALYENPKPVLFYVCK